MLKVERGFMNIVDKVALSFISIIIIFAISAIGLILTTEMTVIKKYCHAHYSAKIDYDRCVLSEHIEKND